MADRYPRQSIRGKTQRWRQLRQQARILRRRDVSRPRRIGSTGAEGLNPGHYGVPNPLFIFRRPTPGRPQTIVLPGSMNLDTDLLATLKIMGELHRELLFGSAARIFIDMSTLESLAPAAALLLHAELDRAICLIQARSVPRQVFGNLPKPGSAARRLLAAIGFFNKLHVRARIAGERIMPPQSLEKDNDWFRVARGSRYVGARSRALVEHYSRHFQIPESWKDLFLVALNETIDNVGQHAYIHPLINRPVMIGCWWLLGCADIEKSRVSFTLWDQGWGVPATMRIGKPGTSGSDEALLRSALLEGGTRLRQPGRGKGLKHLLRLVEKEQARTDVWAGGAHLQYRPNGPPVLSALPYPVPGTLIEWSNEFPLRAHS